ncbi:hypothetical protein MY11210_003638 [Beauveria gryllotalpidicola]
MREARRSLSAETEFDKAEAIVAKANQCEAGSYIDSRWNLNVRMPLLKFVLEFDPVAASTNARPPKQSGKDASDTDFDDEWTEAHANDMRHRMQLGSERPLDDSDGPWERPLIPALSQFCVRGHDWYLYFACDGGNHIDLLDGHWKGSSRDLA